MSVRNRRPYLAPETRDRIAADYEAGVLVAIIARRYGVCISYPAILARRRNLARRNKRREAQP